MKLYSYATEEKTLENPVNNIKFVADEDIKSFRENKFTLILEEYLQETRASLDRKVWQADTMLDFEQMRIKKQLLDFLIGEIKNPTFLKEITTEE